MSFRRSDILRPKLWLALAGLYLTRFNAVQANKMCPPDKRLRWQVSMGLTPINNLGKDDRDILLPNLPQPLTFGVAVQHWRNLSVGLRTYYSVVRDASGAYQSTFFGRNYARQTLSDLTLEIGTSFQLKRYLSLSVAAGPSYVHYSYPVGIHQNEASSMFNNNYPYNWSDKHIYCPGFSVRSDLTVHSGHIGLSVGAFINYNRFIRSQGINFNLILSRLKKRVRATF